MSILELPRGGYIVETPAGYIQFGSPPETIKDSMALPEGVPQYFVLPDRFFNWVKGISVAEVEFPIYYNFFIKKRKTYILCHREQLNPFATILKEAIFGPENLDTSSDFAPWVPQEAIFQLKKELDFFRGGLQLGQLVGFIFFEEGKLKLRDVEIEITENSTFHIYDSTTEYGEIPCSIEYNPTYDIGSRLPEPYKPPLFGMTCLGPSHGFDPKENTSGFILWLNRKGIMIDPPVNTTEWLIDSNVHPKLIDSIILTHCHADHDAGTLQKILEEGKITVYTTETIMQSFLRKYSALTGVTGEFLQQLFDFQPVRIGEPEYIHCGRFTFRYSLHSIPTMGFRVDFQGKSLVYSSDHNADPEIHKQLYREKRISKKRLQEFSSFPWDADIIYHESGIAPLHTPVTCLNSLPDDIRKRTMVYHIASKDFPANTSLTLCRFGIEHTRTLEVEAPEVEKYYHILGLLHHLDFFQNMPLSKAQEFISMVQEASYSKGERIIEKGSRGDFFYIIKSGNISVPGKNLEQRKIYGTYDYFGEVALLNKQPRSADVFAETDVELYTIEGEQFLSFIQGTELEKTLKRLARVRDAETWNILSSSSFFRVLTSSQKTLLESFLVPREIKKPGTIMHEGEQAAFNFIIRSGKVQVSRKGEILGILEKGDFIGDMAAIYREEPEACSYTNNAPVLLYGIQQENIRFFLKNNPGLVMKLAGSFPEA